MGVGKKEVGKLTDILKKNKHHFLKLESKVNILIYYNKPDHVQWSFNIWFFFCSLKIYSHNAIKVYIYYQVPTCIIMIIL